MSFLYNATPISANDAIWQVVQTLLKNALGGVARYIRTSGGGVGGVYSQAGDVWTAAGSGVLANAGAWAVVRGRPFQDGQSTVYREWMIQVDGAGNMRVLYSPRATFVQGAPSTSRCPTASDQEFLFGGGTDAAPTYATYFAGGGYRLQGFASEYDDTYFFLTYPIGGGAATTLWFADMPQNVAVDGSLNLLDKDPLLQYMNTGANCMLDLGLASETAGPRSMLGYGTASALWGRCPATVTCARDAGGALQRVYPGGGSTSLLYPPTTWPDADVRYVRPAAMAGALAAGEAGNANTTDDKGFGSLARWNGGPVVTSPVLIDRKDPVSGQVTSGGTFALGHLLFPWDGTALVV